MIKAIIFDYGGIFTQKGRFLQYAQDKKDKFELQPEKILKIIKPIWDKAKIDEVSCEEFWEYISKRLDISPEELKKDVIEYFGFNEKTLELAKKLKPNYLLAILSNHITDWFEQSTKENNVAPLMDVIYTSYMSKKAKPDIRIFKEIIKKLDVKAEECVYIDDQEKNIPPAKEVGMHAILFKNNNQLEKELKQLKVTF